MNWLVCCSYLLVDHLSLVFVVSSEVRSSTSEMIFIHSVIGYGIIACVHVATYFVPC